MSRSTTFRNAFRSPVRVRGEFIKFVFGKGSLMDRNMNLDECEDNPSSIHDSILNDVICEKAKSLIPEKEQGWYAEYVFHIPANSFSCYLNGKRPFPAWLVVAMDKKFKKTVLLDIMNKAKDGPGFEGPVDPRSIQTLFSLMLREQGSLNSNVAGAIADGFLDADEAESLSRGISKVEHFLDAMRERISEAKGKKAVAS